MPRRLVPRSYADWQWFVEQAWQEGARHIAEGEVILQPETVAALQAIAPHLDAAVMEEVDARSRYARAQHEHRAALQSLTLTIRHFWSVLVFRVRRWQQPIATLGLYGLTQSGKRPPLRGQTDIWLWAERLEIGERHAIAQGLPPMQNPDIGEVIAAREAVEAARARLGTLLHAHQESQTTLVAMRPQLRALYKRTVAELKFAYHDQPAPRRRDYLRAFGIVYADTPRRAEDADG